MTLHQIDLDTDDKPTNTDEYNDILTNILSTEMIPFDMKTIASVCTCSLGMLSIWSDNKVVKCCFTSLLLYKLYKLYRDNEGIQTFVDNML